MRYSVRLGDRTASIELSGSEVLIDGRAIRAEMHAVAGTPLRHLILGDAAYAVRATRGDRPGLWRITINGRTLEVEALDERTRTLREMTGGHAVETDRTIRAPMPGMVVRLEVQPGEAVRAGQGVAVVEAMKMENELVAPADGVVARVEVTPGQVVEKGAVLIVLE